TTDGAAAHRLMHPRFAVPRTYWLRAHGLSAPAVERALGGAVVIDGRPVRIVRWRVRAVARGVELELTLAEGRQRIVRRLAEARPSPWSGATCSSLPPSRNWGAAPWWRAPSIVPCCCTTC